MTEITLRNVTKIYGPSSKGGPAVDDVSLKIRNGEFFFLLGPSGCGKTTLLRILAGLIEPTRGRVLFSDRDVTELPVEKRNAAMVFQNYALWPHMSVQDNTEFGPKMQHRGRAERRELAHENLARVQMAEYARRKPSQLSGGQQQRVALARALAAGADCLLLDEPLSNLDARLRLQMRTELRRLVKAAGTTAVYVTHDQKEALSMADRVAVMDCGRIIQIGTPVEIYTRPTTRFVADFLGEANFLDGTVVSVGDHIEIETPAGILRAARGDFEPGNAVTLCIRPEQLKITGAAEVSPNDSSLHAKIETQTYLGELRQYHCAIPGGQRWKVFELTTGTTTAAESDEIALHFPPDAVTLLRR